MPGTTRLEPALLRNTKNYASSHKGVHLYELDNGLRVVYDFSTQGERVEMRLVCPSGSAFELEDAEKGLRHLGEHMYFATCLDIWAKSAGADLNARTSRNFLVVTCTCDVGKSMDMIEFMKASLAGDHMRKMTQADVDKEKVNVNSEGSMNSNSPVRIVLSELDRKLVRVGNSAPTIGYSETVQNAKKDTVLDLFNKTTGPRNCTLILVGPPAEGYSAKEFVLKTNALFSGVANNPMLRTMEPYRKREHSGVQMINVRRNLGGTLIAMGWPSPAAGQENMTLQIIKEILTMKNGVLDPLKRTPLSNGMGVLIGDVGMEVNAYNYPDTMFLLTSVPCGAETENIKLNFAHMALIQAISSLANFDNQNMLDVALNKVQHQHATMSETLSGRMDLIERGVLASNLNDCKPWWFLDYNQAFSKDVITLQNIREVAAGYLNQNQLVTVNLLQNELSPAKGCADVDSINFNLDRNSKVQLDAQNMSALRSDAFLRDDAGICLTQGLLPSTRCVAVFNYHVPNATSSWAVRQVVPKLFNECGVGLEAASERNIDIKWESNFNDIVATVKCDTNDVNYAMELYSKMLNESKFTKQNVLMVLSNIAASTNSIVHDTKKQCEIAVLNTLCSETSPLYAKTAQQRIESMHNINGNDIQSFISSISQAPSQVGTINYSKGKRRNIILKVCKNAARPSAVEFEKQASVSNKDVLFFPVPSSASYTLKIGQPIHGVSGSDNRKLSQLVVANKIMSNSFNGRLMRKLRTEKSLTYGASSFIESNGSNPIMMMTAAFSPEHIQDGMRESRALLNEFSMGNFTREEFELAKNTAVSLYRTFGTDMSYAESRLKKMLSVDNPYDISVDIDTLKTCSYADVKNLIQSSMKADDFKIVYSGPHVVE